MNELSANEQADLATLVNNHGYKVFTKVMEQEVLKFREDLINISTSDPAAVLAGHQMAKASAMFYGRVKQRLESEARLTQLDVVDEQFEDISSELIHTDLVKEILDGE
jgi:hypothetical protein